MTDVTQTQQKEIDDYGGVVLIGEVPQTFPFSSEEVFSQIATGNMLRIEEGQFCWKKSPFDLKGYVGRLNKTSDLTSGDNVGDLTIDIKVFELRGKKVETYLRVLHEMNASGQNISKYFVEFKFDNGGCGIHYDVVYNDKEQVLNGCVIMRIDEETTCSCFGRKLSRKNKDLGGLRLQDTIPENFIVEGKGFNNKV